MSVRHARVVEIVGRIVRHPDPAHDRAGAYVGRRGERDELLGTQLAERVGGARERRLGRVPLSPVVGREPPADLDAGREMRVEGRHDQPDEADERRDSRHLDGPGAEAVTREVPLRAPRQSVALPSRERRGEVLHDARIRVHRGERLAILGSPLPQQEARRTQKRRAHGSVTLSNSWPLVTESPTATPSSRTTPAMWARISFSIFMASTITST